MTKINERIDKYLNEKKDKKQRTIEDVADKFIHNFEELFGELSYMGFFVGYTDSEVEKIIESAFKKVNVKKIYQKAKV